MFSMTALLLILQEKGRDFELQFAVKKHHSNKVFERGHGKYRRTVSEFGGPFRFLKAFGSKTLRNGAGDAIVGEPMVVVRECPAQWGKAMVDRGELARLRLVEKWPLKRLQAHFECGRTKIKREICLLRKAVPINALG